MLECIEVLLWRRRRVKVTAALRQEVLNNDAERGRAVAVQTGRSRAAPFCEPEFVTTEIIDDYFRQRSFLSTSKGGIQCLKVK